MITFKTNRHIFDFLYNKIDNSKKSIKIAVAWFTDPELSNLLLKKKNIDKIDISIILFNDFINSKLQDARKFGDSLRFSNSLNFDYIMHHKFCIIDDEIVISGSYNWTVKARRFNKENILCIKDENIVAEFNDEFKNLLLNSTIQSQAQIKQVENQSLTFRNITKTENLIINNLEKDIYQKIEDLNILSLEKEFNDEIYRKIEETKEINNNLKKIDQISISLAYKLVEKHTPVIAGKKLTNSYDGNSVQSGLQKLFNQNRLDLSFEESIINTKYSNLFDKETIKTATQKMYDLHFFSNPIYNHLRDRYNQI